MVDEAARRHYLAAMGIDVWIPIAARDQLSAEMESASEQAVVSDSGSDVGSDSPESTMSEWEALAAEVAQCKACVLHKTRTQTVFGTGNRAAQWMLIGEAPGAQEDLQGEPFVGRAGLLLNEMLRAAGLRREEVFIANILKCRPPNNRDPLPAEVAACSGFLERQVALVKPRIILAVGRVAAHNLLKTDASLSMLRGRVHQYRGIPVVVIYHPAYLLRQAREKAKAWQDLQLAMQVFRQQEADAERPGTAAGPALGGSGSDE